MTLRVDHPRRPGLYRNLRRFASGFLAFAFLGVASGVVSLDETPWPLVGGLLGAGLVGGLLYYVRRLQLVYEGAYLQLDDLGLSLGGMGEAMRLGWDEVASAAVGRMGSRLYVRPRGRELEPLSFPLAAWMRRQDEAGEGRITPEELVALLRARVPVQVDGLEGGPDPAGAGLWRALDVLLFAASLVLLLLHGLAQVLGEAPGPWLARAGLLAFGLLGALVGLRGLAARTLVTALGSLRGRAARGFGVLGLVAAALAAGLAALI